MINLYKVTEIYPYLHIQKAEYLTNFTVYWL